MKVVSGGKQIEIEANSRPYLLKRIIADGFDIVLIFAIFMLLTALVMRTPMAGTYRAHVERSNEIAKEYYARLDGVVSADEIREALEKDEEFRNERFAANLHGYLLEALSAFISEGLVLLAVPLMSKERSTPGKLMTGVMLFSRQRRGKASRLQILARFSFVFFIDSLALYLFTGIFTFLLVPVLRLTEMLLISDNRCLCDLMTGLTVIEKISYDGIN
ncbi:MAG: RDD family protein [Firmicutes bacterium]|nr:RDD family protein [Bacillota bacterium]